MTLTLTLIIMIDIDKNLVAELLGKAAVNPRLRQNFDLRTSAGDGSQRMLNALMPGTVVPIHRHPNSNESVMLLCGKVVEVIFEEVLSESGERSFREVERLSMDPAAGNFGCVVPSGAWHTVEVLEPSVIFEAKDGRFGEDGSESA